jgi:phage gp45-like
MLQKLLRWAKIADAGDDDDQFPVQKVSYMGKTGNSIMVFPYGIHGNVPADSLALMFSVQGNPDNRASIAWTPKTRPTLADGEVAFYHPPTDAFIIWREDGNLEIETGDSGSQPITIKCTTATVEASSSISIDTPTATFTGDVNIEGSAAVSGDINITGGSYATDHASDGISFTDHVHSGVEEGSGTTDGPEVI